MFQRTMIIGHLGRDPEMRYLADGTAVASFNVAVDKKFKDREETMWFRVSAWRKLGEVCQEYLSKGRQVMVIGELAMPRVYQGKDGVWRASLAITATDVKFLGSRGGAAQSGPSAADDPGEEEGESYTMPDGSAPPTEQEIPF